MSTRTLKLSIVLVAGILAVALLLIGGNIAQPAPAGVVVPLTHISSVHVMDMPVAYAAVPTEMSYLWTTGGAGDGASTYTRADWSNIAKALGCADGEGVLVNSANELTATLGANVISVGTGYAMVDGKPYYLSAAGDVALASASGGGNSRRYRITLRADWTAQTVRLNIITGTDSASPATPTYSSTSGTLYDVLLYTVQADTSGAITWVADERDWCIGTLIGSTGPITRNQYTGILTIANSGITSAMIAADAITASKIAADSVAFADIGGGVLKITARKGGSASDWQTAGATNYGLTAADVLVQGGVYTATSGSGTVAFPVAFSNKPILVVSTCESYPNTVFSLATDVSATDFDVLAVTDAGSATTTRVCWFAMGPE